MKESELNRDKLMKLGDIIIQAQDEMKNINKVLSKLPGFPEGKVPDELSNFNKKMMNFNSSLQKYKYKVADKLVEQDISTQSFNHFRDPNRKKQSSTYNKSSNLSKISNKINVRKDKINIDNFKLTEPSLQTNLSQFTSSDIVNSVKNLSIEKSLTSLHNQYLGRRINETKSKQIKLPKLSTTLNTHSNLSTNSQSFYTGKSRSVSNYNYNRNKIYSGKTSLNETYCLPREQRANPYYYQPSIPKSQVDLGLNTLIDKGFVSKHLDFTNAIDGINITPVPTPQDMQITFQNFKTVQYDTKPRKSKTKNYHNKENILNIDISYVKEDPIIPEIESRNTEIIQLIGEDGNIDITHEKDEVYTEDSIEIEDHLILHENQEHYQSPIRNSPDVIPQQSTQSINTSIQDESSPSAVSKVDTQNRLNQDLINSRATSKSSYNYVNKSDSEQKNLMKVMKTQSLSNRKNSMRKLGTMVTCDISTGLVFTYVNMELKNDDNLKNFKEELGNRYGTVAFLLKRLINLLVDLKKSYLIFNKDLYEEFNESLNWFQVDAEKLKRYSTRDLMRIPHLDLLSSIIGRKINYKYYHSAIVLQSFIKMKIQRDKYLKLRKLIFFANVIKEHWRIMKLRQFTNKKVADNWAVKYEHWLTVQNNFCTNWTTIKTSRRLEIHVSSLSYDGYQRCSMEKYLYRENIQISRIFNSRDPNVDILYVVPYALSDEILDYYWKLLDLQGIAPNSSRVKFMVPSMSAKFPGNMNLSKVLYYSDDSLNEIKAIYNERIASNSYAYIVPGVMSDVELKLSVYLKIPMYSALPELHQLYSTKSGAKRLFNISSLPTPPNCIDIYDKIEFFTNLTRLIFNNLYVNRWIFKIDNEFRGRGTAFIDLEHFKILRDIRRHGEALSESYLEKLYETVCQFVPKYCKFAVPSLYGNFNEYLVDYTRYGGIIEAAPFTTVISNPCFGMNIEPDGNVTIICSYDRISHEPYVSASYTSPAIMPEQYDYEQILKFGKILFKHGVKGYCCIDFISFKDPTGRSDDLIHWAIDIDLNLTDFMSCSMFVNVLIYSNQTKIFPNYKEYEARSLVDIETVKAEKNQDKYLILDKYGDKYEVSEKRYLCYIPYMYNPSLTRIQYKTFFNMCRVENINYNTETRMGSIFLLCDSLNGGCVGLLCLGDTLKCCLEYVCTALRFIETQTASNQILEADIKNSDKLNFEQMGKIFKILYSKNK